MCLYPYLTDTESQRGEAGRLQSIKNVEEWYKDVKPIDFTPIEKPEGYKPTPPTEVKYFCSDKVPFSSDKPTDLGTLYYDFKNNRLGIWETQEEFEAWITGWLDKHKDLITALAESEDQDKKEKPTKTSD